MTGRDLLALPYGQYRNAAAGPPDRQLQRGSNFAVWVRPGQLCVFRPTVKPWPKCERGGGTMQHNQTVRRRLQKRQGVSVPGAVPHHSAGLYHLPAHQGVHDELLRRLQHHQRQLQGGVNLQNYQDLFADDVFLKALSNTSIYVVFVVLRFPSCCPWSLLYLSTTPPGGKAIFQTLYFLPYVTSVIAIGIVWSWIFNSNYGLLNYFLSLFGIDAIPRLNDPPVCPGGADHLQHLEEPGLQHPDLFCPACPPFPRTSTRLPGSIPPPQMRVFFKITVPQLRPIIVYAFLMGLINAFQGLQRGVLPVPEQGRARQQCHYGGLLHLRQILQQRRLRRGFGGGRGAVHHHSGADNGPEIHCQGKEAA